MSRPSISIGPRPINAPKLPNRFPAKPDRSKPGKRPAKGAARPGKHLPDTPKRPLPQR